MAGEKKLKLHSFPKCTKQKETRMTGNNIDGGGVVVAEMSVIGMILKIERRR